MPVKRHRYAYACELERLYRCAKAPTHATTYSILSKISFLSMAMLYCLDKIFIIKYNSEYNTLMSDTKLQI